MATLDFFIQGRPQIIPQYIKKSQSDFFLEKAGEVTGRHQLQASGKEINK